MEASADGAGIEQEAQEKMNRDWMLELPKLRFICLSGLLLINDFGLLSDERKRMWIEYLKKGYPSLKVIFV